MPPAGTDDKRPTPGNNHAVGGKAGHEACAVRIRSGHAPIFAAADEVHGTARQIISNSTENKRLP